MLALGALIAVSAGSCDDAPTTPPVTRIEFSVSSLELGAAATGALAIRNRGTRPVGPVRIETGPVRAGSGSAVPGAGLRADPDRIPTLPAGTDREVAFSLHADEPLPLGSYTVSIEARDGSNAVLATLDATFELACPSDRPIAAELVPIDPPERLGRGEVATLEVEARNADGVPIDLPCLRWELDGGTEGFVDARGRFVSYRTGTARVIARSGEATVPIEIPVHPRGAPDGNLVEVGQGRWTEQHTSDLWVWGDVAYTGTWGQRPDGAREAFGNALHAWDISEPSAPVRTHTIEVDARTVNDVKIRDDGTLAVMTHENSDDGLNGITLLDLSDPARPEPIARYSEGLEAGIHNVWIDGDHVYLVVNGIGNGLRVLDVSDPRRPALVSSYYEGSSFLHDVYVRDGLAFLAQWNDGLIILDVGHGAAGGSPSNPVELGRTTTTGGRTHNAWYWPEQGWVFVGEENFNTPGRLHVIDARDLTAPREVATYEIPGHTPHNVWLDEQRGVLYAAWYGHGLRAIDVTGELMGELERQGREIARSDYGTPPSANLCAGSESETCTWAPQLHRGLVFVSDLNSGLRVLRPEF